MKKLKIYVYAICKNERKFVDTYIKSMSEADGIYVLDTGSTDDTVEKLKKYKNVCVKQMLIKPFRFDIARNKSLEMVPEDADICVCTDFDEEFNPGWRDALENIWIKENPTRVEYLYHWSFDAYKKPATTFYMSKIHKRNIYKWVHPVHEVLECVEVEKSIIVPEMILNHHQDFTKKRSSYLPLLEMSVKEDPEDDRNMHYLGREYMYYERFQEAIDTLHKHLKLKKSTWKDERAASMRFMARSYIGLQREEEAKMWYKLAIVEAPYLREAYVELASMFYHEENYVEAYNYLKQASKITEKTKTYINEDFCWNAYFYDMLSVVSFYLGYKEEALENAKIAHTLDPKEERIQKNITFMEEALQKPEN